MEDIFLVEIRLARTKWRIRNQVSSIARSFQLEGFMERHPHVTLFGPFLLRDGVDRKEILGAIGSIAGKYDPVPFLIDSWEKREGMHGTVIAYVVRPSESLIRLSSELATLLTPLTDSLNAWDSQPEKKWFHSTIANRLDAEAGKQAFARLDRDESPVDTPEQSAGSVLDVLRDLIRGKKRGEPHPRFHPPLLDDAGLRITLMQGDGIFAEYDLLEKRWIMAGHDHHGLPWRRTLQAFRYHAGFEKQDPDPAHTPQTFVISDLHLGHANIIRYCSRPFSFSDPEEMDHVLLKNWNYTVSPSDTIFHLGDFRYGITAKPVHAYVKKLHGQITFIAGNHDEEGLAAVPSARLEHGGRRYLLIHDPDDAPESFDGWILHGHHHNNDLRTYPFISFQNRRINVSAEILGYVPVSLEEISHILNEQEKSGDTSPILLRYSGRSV